MERIEELGWERALNSTYKVAGITSSRLRSHVTFGRHDDASVGGPQVCEM